MSVTDRCDQPFIGIIFVVGNKFVSKNYTKVRQLLILDLLLLPTMDSCCSRDTLQTFECPNN